MIIIRRDQKLIILKDGSPLRDEENDLLVSKVASLVVSHITLGPEALTASLWAVEGSLVDMDALMDA